MSNNNAGNVATSGGKSLTTTIIIIILYCIISTINVVIDLVDTGTDIATVGVSGLAGVGWVDLGVEILAGIIEILLFVIIMFRSDKSLTIKLGCLAFFVITTIINVIFSVFGALLPFVDVPEAVVESFFATIRVTLIGWLGVSE